MCPSRSVEALRGHINVPFVYKELNKVHSECALLLGTHFFPMES